MKKPPKKLSKPIRLALHDLALVERSKKYVVRMAHWHTALPPSSGGALCSVCFAGSVMAKTLNTPMDKEIHYGNLYEFGHGWSRAFEALDEVRKGNVSAALAELGQPREYGYDREATVYSEDPKQWRKDMWKIVRELEKDRL